MILEVTPEHIASLSDPQLRELVGKLAELEVSRAGHSAAAVTYGGHQNASDGGIDVRVDIPNGAIEGFVPKPATGYQVKAENMTKASIENEMRIKGTITPKPSIVELGKAGGSYIIVSSKGAASDTALATRKNAMAAVVANEPEAAGLHVDFYDRQRLATWVNQHPSLILWVRKIVGQPIHGWQAFDDWSSSPNPILDEYIVDGQIRLVGGKIKDSNGVNATDGINMLRTTLSKSKGAVRLVGLSGVGKTRLAQALFDARVGINALNEKEVLYTDLSDSPNPLPLDLVAHLQSLNRRCVMIVDNCGSDLHRKLVAKLKSSDCNISLLTIEYDISDDKPESTDTFKLEPASTDLIKKVLERKYPDLTAVEINTITDFSEGNSRIAIALADTSKEGDSLAELHDKELIERLFHQKNKHDSAALLAAAKVCSLVYSFNVEDETGDEADLPILADLAQQSLQDMHAHIAILYRRQLVQKRSKWRAILPHALAHKLAMQALEEIPLKNLNDKLVAVANERLLISFSRRLGCLHNSSEAKKIASAWLGSGGILEHIDRLSKAGMTILDNVAPIDPGAVLSSIEQKIHEKKIPSDGGTNKHRLALLLRSIAYEPEHFTRAGLIIASFARGQSASNNDGDAINVFKSLFYIYLSGTHASAKQRVELLKGIAIAGHPEDVELVLGAFDALIECNHFSSHYGFEFGTRKRDYGLHPNTHEEIREWFLAIIELTSALIEIPIYSKKASDMFASHFRWLARACYATDELIHFAKILHSREEGWSQGWAGTKAAARSLKKKKREEESKKFSDLAKVLEPNDLSTKIATYVLPEQWGSLDVAELEIEDDKRYEAVQKKIHGICEEIGIVLSADLPAFVSHLPSLLKSKSNRVSILSERLGKSVKDIDSYMLAIAQEISKDEYKEINPALLSYFVLGVSEANPQRANELLDQILISPELNKFFVHSQAVCGLDNKAVERLISATSIDSISVDGFWILHTGRVCDNLSGQQFKNLIVSILSKTGGFEPALAMMRMRVFSKSQREVTLDTNDKDAARILLDKLSFDKRGDRLPNELDGIIKTCLSSPLDDPLAKKLCKRLLDGINSYKISPYQYGKFLAEIAAKFPRIVLDTFVDRDNSAGGRRAIFSNFRENYECPLSKIDPEILLEWANKSPEMRFVKLAESIKPWAREASSSSNDNSSYDSIGTLHWTETALRMLKEAPNPLDVLSQFLKALRPSSYSGSLSHILESRVSLLEDLINQENESISTAAKQALANFKNEIEDVKKWEADRWRKDDERFEW